MLLSKLRTATAGLLLVAVLIAAAGAIYQTQAAEQPKEEQRNRTVRDGSTSGVAPPRVADQREYVIQSRLMEAGADQPREILRLPKMTVDDGQLAPIHITDGPENLLEKVVLDEKIKIGTFLDVRVKRLRGNKVRLFVSFQRNELEKASVSQIRALGNSLQAIQDVELHKPVKMVFQKDARGSAQRWVEIMVDEQTIPAAADKEKLSPARNDKERDARKDAPFPDGRSHDFGKVKPSTKLKHTFRIVNTSDAVLALTSVRVSAACVAGALNKKVLQPGEEGKLEVTVDARRFKGARTMWVFLDMDHHNDIGTIIFTVTANSENNDFDPERSLQGAFPSDK
jgi:hypothetical protein